MSRIVTESTGAACALTLAGFPLERAFVGRRGRVEFTFPPEAADVFRAYRRANQEVRASIERVRQTRRQEPLNGPVSANP